MLNLPFFGKKNYKIKPLVLVILDGFGIAPASSGNAITQAKTPNYDSYLKYYPHSELIASGESVGLPANEVGNTEVGHLTIGAGRAILQDLKRINLAIEKGTFFDNRAFLQATAHVKSHKSRFHIIGLVSSGNVHSSINHLLALLQFCKKEEIRNLFLHIFTDGRDAPPNEAAETVEKLLGHLETIKIGKIATISGRYYAMDRDRRWDRTERAYKAVVLGEGKKSLSAIAAIKDAYSSGQTDEFIEPTILTQSDGSPVGLIEDNDAVIFFNYRIDRPRQLTMALTIADFEHLKSFEFGYDPEKSKEEGNVALGQTFVRGKVPKNLFFVTMTLYHKNIPVSAVAFPPEEVAKPLSEIMYQKGIRQLHMAESEKERFVTYYFDGMREERFPGEEVLIVPSPKVTTYDKKPEMSLPKLVSEFKKKISEDVYHFIVINFANPDMVAHSGNLEKTISAIEIVDKYLGDLVVATQVRDGVVLITADHGNAEELLSYPASSYFFTTSGGSTNTDHSTNPVPLIIAGESFRGRSILPNGSLSDVAPTILGIMDIANPPEMTGRYLLKEVVKI